MEEIQAHRFMNGLNIAFYLLVAMPLTAFGILALRFKDGATPHLDPGHEFFPVLNIVLPIVVVAEIAAAYFIFKKQIKKAPANGTLEEKLKAYRGAALLQFSLLTYAAIFCLLGYWFTGLTVHMVLFFLVLLFFSLVRPSVMRIAKVLKLPRQEREFLFKVPR